MKIKIKDIPSGVMFYPIGPTQEDTTDVYQTFMLDGGYTLQTTKYVCVKNLTKTKYIYWDADIYVNKIT